MIDPATLVLGVIALLALIFVAVSFPAVWREHKEWKRRQRLTPLERAMEDLGLAFDNLATAFVTMFIPVIEGVTAPVNGLAEALKVDTEPDGGYSRTRVDVPLETERRRNT